MFTSLYRWFHNLTHKPVQVFWICCALLGVGVLLDGTAFRLWSLHRDHQFLTDRIKNVKQRSHQLAFRIQKAQQPEFIERAARDQFDLVKEGDLIFIFSEDDAEASGKSKD